jgi:cyclopropane-fatty-acyl-phospholipid synthase
MSESESSNGNFVRMTLAMSSLKPYFDDVQAHYDLSDEFFFLFLDPSRTYSCAYFEREDMTLEEAQYAKIDLALGKLGLEPGMTLLDVGCGWGGTVKRAVEKYDVNVIGLTLSKNQSEHVAKELENLHNPNGRSAEVRLQGWEQFDQPVDRIVSIGAFEHFRRERYEAFFAKAHRVLPEHGRLLLHTIVSFHVHELAKRGVNMTSERLRFILFISKVIFPGGQLPSPEIVREHSAKSGFTLEREHALSLNYARTLDIWRANLEANKEQAIELAGKRVYDIYIKYLTGSARGFRERMLDVVQFTLVK